jgi:phage FluMu protein Com
MKHFFVRKDSKLNIRCWSCSEILLSISTDGSFLNFNSTAEFIELDCPVCQTTCEYSLIRPEDGLFLSHNWDSDIDSLDFEGETGETNRNLLRQYKLLLENSESSAENIMESEFDIVGDYLEFLSEQNLVGSEQSQIIKNIEKYINDCRGSDHISKNREKTYRRALNRFYKLLYP